MAKQMFLGLRGAPFTRYLGSRPKSGAPRPQRMVWIEGKQRSNHRPWTPLATAGIYYKKRINTGPHARVADALGETDNETLVEEQRKETSPNTKTTSGRLTSPPKNNVGKLDETLATKLVHAKIDNTAAIASTKAHPQRRLENMNTLALLPDGDIPVRRLQTLVATIMRLFQIGRRKKADGRRRCCQTASRNACQS